MPITQAIFNIFNEIAPIVPNKPTKHNLFLPHNNEHSKRGNILKIY